jgi:hypothetical protein
MFIFALADKYFRDFLMNKYQSWLIVSIVLLAFSFIVPIYIFYNALGENLRTAVNILPDYNASSAAQAPPPSQFYETQSAAQLQLLYLVIAVEAVLVVSFAVTFWYAIKCRDQCRRFPPPA